MIQRPRGTRDFGPEEMEKRRWLEGVMRSTARGFGFGEVATPTFEHTELFALKSGPNIVDEIYAFQDKGGRDISLRPELTAPVIRFFVNDLSNTPRPLKVFYMGPCFRYERPQSGRYREFHQFGVELIGTKTPESDAEVIGLAARIMEAIGLKEFTIRIGHIGILRKMLSDAGLDPESSAAVLQKLDKKLYEEARPMMQAVGMEDDQIGSIFDLTEVCGEVSVLDEMEGEAIDHLKGVLDVLSSYGLENVQVDLGVVRGLDYYTGIVFEVEAPSLGAEKQVCGGGSYSLSELFGGERVFSTGFAIGFDRVLLALENEGLEIKFEGLDAFVIPVKDAQRIKAFEIVSMLRRSGVRADVDLMRRSLGKNFKYADSVGAKYAVIVGEKELDQDSVTVRDMGSGEQKLVSLQALAEFFI
ncbi:MAG TPA: histidine--tRNA ligase [Methanomassiliicoccales archaeon]|nr:histidine--tRNA ligase [Methanomassiliicoccales archaeon]